VRQLFRFRKPVRYTLLVLILAFASAMPAVSQNTSSEKVDLQMATRIRQEGFHNSKVMEIMGDLSDRLGQRLTASANQKRANEWARELMTSWGLQNAHLESFPFGRGWHTSGAMVTMTSPDVAQMYVIPKAWTPGTNGTVKGEVVHFKATAKEDLDKAKGTLAGKIVFIGDLRDIKVGTEPASKRYDEKSLSEVGDYQIPGERLSDPTGRVFTREDIVRRFQFQRELNNFLIAEKPAVVIEGSRGDNGLIFVGGSQAYRNGEADGVPWLYMAAEHFNRVVRLVDRKVPVEMEVEVKSQFESGDGNSWNTIAEIPGTDKKDELVMTGAHIDSWHAGTGATDDGAGVAITMEAMRILQSLGVKPRRTIRIGLWGGEEQGLLGSRAYATEHLGKRQEPARAQGGDNGLPSFMRPEQGTLMLKPEQAKISAYFNIDNGTGKLRGIYTQENSSVAPIFAAWGEPFRDLGFTTITNRNTGGTDHLSFDAVGVPGFQFIQDPVEYMTRTHHSNMDVYDRIQREDMMQASVILAAFLYDAAMRDDMMPRKALPKDTQMEQAKVEPTKDVKPVKKKK
jgi:carboxypeptidase Q